jgi:hypothetical protein
MPWNVFRLPDSSAFGAFQPSMQLLLGCLQPTACLIADRRQLVLLSPQRVQLALDLGKRSPLLVNQLLWMQNVQVAKTQKRKNEFYH